ncbi:DUF5813 family protein [Halococcoides cellulosivorans]|uniref:Uncharacterized protein n=1 Tax=Halococcoides cellulosivorans TaxID=1679096 RepID=A0A2R4X1N5_9EURY|nr:DUF5813 family protein [Halococcoides cellulosivorans]AWB27714.1 hypothetical protein HARCEL1_08330 [Halococcoides cellulosivorans]
MTDATIDVPDAIDSVEARADGTVTVTATPLQTAIRRTPTDEPTWTVEIRVPTIDAVATDPVGAAVQDDWFETFRRRAREASGATRRSIDPEVSIDRTDDHVVVTYAFEERVTDRALEVARDIALFVEGTYVQGAIPGYDYEPPLSKLLHRAKESGDPTA